MSCKSAAINSGINAKERTYIDSLKSNGVTVGHRKVSSILFKKPMFNYGIPRVTWREEEIKSMNIYENLPYAVIGKFSFEWPDLDDLRKILPK